MILHSIESIWQKKWAFFGTFFAVFMLSYLFLVAIDFVPEPPKTEELVEQEPAVAAEQSLEAKFTLPMDSTHDPVLPQSIYIKKLDKEVTVFNPESREVADLDAALLNGVVRHPDSADLAEDGNVFLLGHSSHLPTVINKNFQAFNGIETLEWGDIIEVTSEGYIHTYEVEKVYKANAKDTTVPIAGTGPRLTLATCNSFGSTDDRFIVEARRVSVRAI